MSNNKKNTVLLCDELTRAGRIYPIEEVAKAIDTYNRKGYKFVHVGKGDKIRIEDIVGEVKSLEMDGKEVVGDIKWLDTTAGKTARDLVEKKWSMLYPVGFGKVDGDGVVSDYSISSVCVSNFFVKGEKNDK